jgi:hypothetical protein
MLASPRIAGGIADGKELVVLVGHGISCPIGRPCACVGLVEVFSLLYRTRGPTRAIAADREEIPHLKAAVRRSAIVPGVARDKRYTAVDAIIAVCCCNWPKSRHIFDG